MVPGGLSPGQAHARGAADPDTSGIRRRPGTLRTGNVAAHQL